MGRKKTNTFAYRKKLSVVRKILKLVALRENQGMGEYTYWGFDTEMKADLIEREAVNKIDHFLRNLDPLDEIFIINKKHNALSTEGEK